MTEILGAVSIGLITGAVVGLVFFGGLRHTVERLPTARRPGVLFATSLFVRLAVLLAAFVALGQFVGPVAVLATVPTMIAARRSLIVRYEREEGAG